MNDRPNDIKRIRPEVPKAKVNESMSLEEQFQNATLRPIAKLQNPLLIAVFKNYIAKHKNVFHNLPIEKRLIYVENAIQRDMRLRNNLKGMVIGQFTVEEYLEYCKNESALNKRMMNIIRERLISQIQLFDNANALNKAS